MSRSPEPGQASTAFLDLSGGQDSAGRTVTGRNAVPDERFFQICLELIRRRKPFAVATVITVRGSASADAGSKAILSQDGRNLFGWVGGGCAENFVIHNAMEAIEAGVPRVIQLDLDGDVFGLEMPCGGSVDVYIEPVLPPRRLRIEGSEDDVSRLFARWANRMGFSILGEGADEADYVLAHGGGDGGGLPIKARSPAEEAIALAGRMLALETSASCEPLWKHKKIPEEFWPQFSGGGVRSHLALIGHSRITEGLAVLAASLDWQVTVNGHRSTNGNYPETVRRLSDESGDFEEVNSGSFVVIATQHKDDFRALSALLERSPAYIGMIASRTRAGLVFDELKSQGKLAAARPCFHAPCGLDLGGGTPFEIALSILCEIIACHNRNEEPRPQGNWQVAAVDLPRS